MKLLMHILKKNDKLGIDEEKLQLDDVKNKLSEEYIEVVNEVIDYKFCKNENCLKNIVRETFDLIQVCILLLWRCHKEAKSFGQDNLIQDINIEHKDKLMGRGWIPQTGIEIEVKE